MIGPLVMKSLVSAAKASLPVGVYASLKRHHRKLWWGRLRRVEPISRSFGLDRGQPIDRYYIEQFLDRHANDIRGNVLEFGDDHYTRQFGDNRVTHSDVIHVREGNPNATIVADLCRADHIPSNSFDCIICTQTLMFIYDVNAAMRTLHRILKPGGSLLATVAGISQICRADMEQWGDYWRFTPMALRRVVESQFAPQNVDVHGAGNVLAAVAFLHGLPLDELRTDELEHDDPDYPLIVTGRAVKQGDG